MLIVKLYFDPQFCRKEEDNVLALRIAAEEP